MVQHIENEESLLARARQGDPEAFTTLVRWYERNIYRLALGVMGSQEDAEDIVQEALLKAYCNLDKFRGTSRFYTWLVRIIINEGLMRLRSRRRFPTTSVEVQFDIGNLPRQTEHWIYSPEKRLARKELRRLLTRAILRLQPTFRIVFLLRDVEGFSTEEVGDMIGISKAAVKSRLMRARLKLRELLNRHFSKKSRR